MWPQPANHVTHLVNHVTHLANHVTPVGRSLMGGWPIIGGDRCPFTLMLIHSDGFVIWNDMNDGISAKTRPKNDGH